MPKIDRLHFDFETFSSEDITKCGAYRYTQSFDFEILMCAYAFNDEPVRIVDLAAGEKLPKRFLDALPDRNILKCAHNANFERNGLKAYGIDVPVDQWECTQVKAAYCGLPLSLGDISEALKLGDKSKLAIGKQLIRYFSVPQKPVKANNYRHRNFWYDDPEKWELYKEYCMQDVEAERVIDDLLAEYTVPDTERRMYFIDQHINDRGIRVDIQMAENAVDIDEVNSAELTAELQVITGLDNPNSPTQLKEWLSEAMQQEITTLAKAELETLIKEAGKGCLTEAHTVLKLRQKAAKSSIKKYVAMLNSVCDDGRIHGLFQFYGANRTGRWAGRLVQMQNLPQNHLDDLDEARSLVVKGDYDLLGLYYDNISDVLSQLIRTTFIAKEGHTFAVADFSAIEARVIAWLAGEKWRLEVFKTHGMIYEASASMMFGVTIESIVYKDEKGNKCEGVNYSMRQKGKVAELALGYQGALGALKTMGGEKMGLSESEMLNIVKLWRKENRAIVALWGEIEKAAIKAIRNRTKVVLLQYHGLEFDCDGKVLTIKLPSGRKLFYQSPKLTTNRFGNVSVKYMGMNQETKKWGWVESYGGKFVENIVQAIARDLLADSMIRLTKWGFDIVMHVHDEVVCEVPRVSYLKDILTIMGEPVEWAPGLMLRADGYTTDYYKKD